MMVITARPHMTPRAHHPMVITFGTLARPSETNSNPSSRSLHIVSAKYSV